MRLIDADSFLKKMMQTNRYFSVKFDILEEPTIDPETLPIVQQLRAELWKTKAERDAAVKNRAKLAEYELTVCEEFCYGDAQHDIPPCEWLVDGKCALREWVKEYA